MNSRDSFDFSDDPQVTGTPTGDWIPGAGVCFLIAVAYAASHFYPAEPKAPDKQPAATASQQTVVQPVPVSKP